ncbi:unnamed protein product [Symbiodinium sp. CCMP2592]|nr:unnamed protein product [Symbiodinium sp. CCMP2592]
MAAMAGSDDFDALGRFILRGFDKRKPMSSFLPGVGGFWGLPMWTFYVNRGQGISCFGILNKDGPIMRFESAEAAYRTTAIQGFRTLMNLQRPGLPARSYQPFFNEGEGARDMLIGMNEMEIREINNDVGLKTEVLYFTVPNEEFPALVRKVTVTNLGDTNLHLSLLDGLMKLEPTGIPHENLVTMGRTMEAWKNVYNTEDGDMRRPFFHISSDPADIAQVKEVENGHFVVAFVDGEYKLLPFVVDPVVVFEHDTSFRCPHGFTPSTSPEALASGEQCKCARTPCALAAASEWLAPGQKVTINSIYGHASNITQAVEKFIPKVCTPGFVCKKMEEARSIPGTLTKKVATETASPIFNQYINFNFWDNLLRGGLPHILGDLGNGARDHPKVYHCFSRIHGDMERDYNNFQLDLTYFSQGPGNYRDVNQNRRVDVFFEPRVRDFNVRQFLSFIQADGYNPLSVATPLFKMPGDSNLNHFLARVTSSAGPAVDELKKLLQAPFRPGDLFKAMEKQGCSLEKIGSTLSREQFLHILAREAQEVPVAKYNQNGFWSDHWTYNMDLLDNFLTIYPDKEFELLFGLEPIPFFLSPSTVQPRSRKYRKLNDGTVIQVDAVLDGANIAKPREQLLKAARSGNGYVEDPLGNNNAWHLDAAGHPMVVSVGSKLLIVGVLKFATLDPLGMGIQMETGKPGWNDAMNGLPGILGSTMPESYETLRVLKYLKRVIQRYPKQDFEVPTEMHTLMQEVETQLGNYCPTSLESQHIATGKVPSADFAYWGAVSTAREIYHESILGPFCGSKQPWSSSRVAALLDKMVAKMEHGIGRALKFGNGMTPCYFSYKAEIRVDTDSSGEVAVPLSFEMPTVYPLFLEAFVRQLKVTEGSEDCRKVYQKVKSSPLYDTPLKMYKVCESLKGQPLTLGRMLAFPPGWLENESIWLHMSYKYLLELLRGRLFSEFFDEIKTGLVPFMDVKRYGRSPLEASSFLASTALPDKRLHGTGFVARLSGSTAEMMSMWTLMFAGPQPFRSDGAGSLELAFEPALPSWLFKDDGTVSFTFLGCTKVTYHNAARKNTWELDAPQRVSYSAIDGESKTLNGGVLPRAEALLARELKLATIDVYY